MNTAAKIARYGAWSNKARRPICGCDDEHNCPKHNHEREREIYWNERR